MEGHFGAVCDCFIKYMIVRNSRGDYLPLLLFLLARMGMLTMHNHAAFS